MVCPDCGKELSESALFCRYCGIPVAAAPKSAATADESAAVAEMQTGAAEKPAAVAEMQTGAAEEPITDAGKPASMKKKHVRRALVSLLLFFIFAGGLAVCGRFTFRAWQEYHTPYQEAAYAALDEELAKREGCADKIAELEALLKTNVQETKELESTLARYHIRREEEILNTVTSSVEIDYDALFGTEFFSSAYLQYIDDLLNAFRQDALTDSWLYPYYEYSVNYGANDYIGRDLWIYDSDAADEKFSGLLDPRHFCVSVYTASLSDHFTQNSHLYVTGLDMLGILFGIPGYVLDEAVFVKAYGGNPYPSEMEVPGWRQQDYDDFWEAAGGNSDSAYAVWENFGLSALDFNIDWNTLVDEAAYYKAYEEFMDAVAPGLERYNIAQYVPDDDYYGGVRYNLFGTEASQQEIAAAYIAGHPDCLAELGINTETLPSSYDDLIAEAKLQLKELTDTTGELTLQKSEYEWLQNSEAFFRQQRESLAAMEQHHMELLTRTLWTFTLFTAFLLIMAVASLRRFFRNLR